MSGARSEPMKTNRDQAMAHSDLRYLRTAKPLLLVASLAAAVLSGCAGPRDQLTTAIVGGVLTGIAAWLSVRFLMRYFEGRGRLASFGVYCVIAGALCLGWFMLHQPPAA